MMLKRERLNKQLMQAAYKVQQELAEAYNKLLASQATKSLTVPSCPRCGGRMTIKTNSKLGTQFFGCINFPSCKKTINID